MSLSSPSSAPARKRLLVVDDHPIIRQGIQQLLNQEPDLCVAAQAADARQALHALRAQAFDLVVLDISLRGVSGIDLLKDIRANWPKLPVLILSMHAESLYAERALRAGARGYIMKQECAERVVDAVRDILAGRLHVSEAVRNQIAGVVSTAESGETNDDGGGGLDGREAIALLSDRELEVFRFIGRGWGTRAMAAEMRVSVKTVEIYRAHIKTKLKLKDGADLMRRAVNWASAKDEG